MAAFTTNMTTTAQVDDSILLAYKQGVWLANGETQKLEQYVTVREEIGAKAIRFTKFPRLALATTPLIENEDVPGKQMSDTSFLVTPVEYGDAMTSTTLASLQTGGLVDQAKVKQIGTQMGSTQDQLIINAALTSPNTTNTYVTGATLDAAYSRLVTKSVVPGSEGFFTAVMAESEISRIRNDAGFLNALQYAKPEALLSNEVGMYKGFRIIRHQQVPAGAVITFGSNALGKAVSKAPEFVVTPPTDKLGRFWNMGWYGVFAYSLIDTDATELLVKTA